MKKVLLFLMTCMLLSTTLNGQTKLMRFAANVPGNVPRTEAVDPNLLPWGYCGDDASNSVGVNAVAELSVAIFVPTKLVSQYVGNQIRAISVSLTAKSTSLSVFIASTLTGEKLYEQSVGNGNVGWNEVTLTTPFDLTAKDIYVGYTCTGKNQVGYSAGPSDENANWLGVNGEWANYAKEGWGSLGIKIYLGGDNMPEKYVALSTLDKAYGEVNKPFAISGTVKNEGIEKVQNIDVDYKAGDIEGTANISMEVAPGATGEFALTVPALASIGDFDTKVTITKVNGSANENVTTNAATNKVTTLEMIFPKRVLLEEGTGTWCGWCPRGMVAMKMMKEKYPETSIGIAVHSGDKMETNTYSSLGKFFTGYPSSVVNRKKAYVGDPYFAMEGFYKEEIKTPAQIGISVAGNYLSSTVLEATSTTTFGFTADNANYKITFVLIENGVTGYSQSNSYAGGSQGEMGGFEKLKNPVPADQIVYDEVAIGIFPYAGIQNSVPTSVVKGQSYTFKSEITLPKTVQNRLNLELIALLLDGKTGEVINAAKVETKDMTNGIESVDENGFNVKSIKRGNNLDVEIAGSQEKVQVELFNMEGKQVGSVVSVNGIAQFSTAGLKGVYFVKANDGKNIVVDKVVLY